MFIELGSEDYHSCETCHGYHEVKNTFEKSGKKQI
jgi:hypothetical protein